MIRMIMGASSLQEEWDLAIHVWRAGFIPQ
jgi:hypothetical protein